MEMEKTDFVLKLAQTIITIGSDLASERSFINNNKSYGALLKNVSNILIKNFNIGADANNLITPIYKNGRGAVKAEQADYSHIGGKLAPLRNLLAGFDSIAVKIINSLGSSVENNRITTSKIGIEAILNRIQESTLQIQRNYIEKCSRAISVENETQTYIAGNIISDNVGIGSGIHMFNSGGQIVGNILKNDAGDAIYLEDNSNPVVSKNNIYNNAGLGLRNESPAIQISAQNNWWGDASGPGGQGPGSGDGVSANIDFQNWRSEAANLIILSRQDTTYQLAGVSDTLSSAILNWASPNDVVDISLSDTRGWLSGSKSFSISLDDSFGKSFSIPVLIPANTSPGQVNTITINAQSQLNTAFTDQGQVYVSTYLPELTTMVISPDFVNLTLGDTLQFSVTGYDQVNNKFSFGAEWSADIGSIDQNGLYLADEIDSAATVTVIDLVSQLKAMAKVQINYVTGLNNRKPENPQSYTLSQNYPNPFNPATTIKYALPKQSYVSLIIYNMLGREVKTLVSKTQNSGTYTIRFDATNLASGLYFYRLQAGNFTQIKKMLLVK
jgi:parallel beta-helix repeat protein